MYAPSGATLILHILLFFDAYILICTAKSDNPTSQVAIPIYLSEGGLTIPVKVSTKTYYLALSGRLEGIYLFSNKLPFCKDGYEPEKSDTAEWCNNPNEKCSPIIVKFQCNRGKKLDYHWGVKIGPFAFDSLYYTPEIIQGYENIKIDSGVISNSLIDIPLSSNKRAFAGTAPIALVTNIESYNNWPLFRNISGIFGLVGPSLCCRDSSLWWNIIGDYENTFQLSLDGDFTLPKDFNKVGNIILGKPKEDYIWSNPRHIGGVYSDAFMQFTVFNFKMCNVELFGKTSSNWEAIIDPTCRCLGLPKNFWLTLMKYLPIDSKDCLDDKNSPRICKLKSPYPKLPTITFTLNEDINSPKLEIPLESLLFKLNESDTDLSLCIVPTDISSIKKNSAITTFPSIKFGYQVISNFKIAVDQGNYKIGFINKKNFIGSDDVCSKKIDCKGDQVYCPAMNTCLNPECKIWLLKSYDPETGTCKFNMWALLPFWITIAIIGLFDIHSYFSYRRLINHTRKLCK